VNPVIEHKQKGHSPEENSRAKLGGKNGERKCKRQQLEELRKIADLTVKPGEKYR